MPARTDRLTARLTNAAELAEWRSAWNADARVALVPTMGGLHAGHEALVRRAAAENDAVCVSIFVNPIQFDEQADFERYPRPLEDDIARIHEAGGHAVYVPAVADMYPPGCATRVLPGPAGDRYEGAHRAGHFAGVLTVVHKLFQRVGPTHAYFGEKDAQQLYLIEAMVRDLDMPVAVVPCATVREEDGLAMSSRNRHLSADDRAAATVLYRALSAASQLFEQGERGAGTLESAMQAVYGAAGIEADYADVIDADSFAAPTPDTRRWRALTAARVGSTRLIDNLFLGTSA